MWDTCHVPTEELRVPPAVSLCISVVGSSLSRFRLSFLLHLHCDTTSSIWWALTRSIRASRSMAARSAVFRAVTVLFSALSSVGGACVSPDEAAGTTDGGESQPDSSPLTSCIPAAAAPPVNSSASYQGASRHTGRQGHTIELDGLAMVCLPTATPSTSLSSDPSSRPDCQ